MNERRDRWGKVITQRNANQRAYTARNRERLSAARKERRATDKAYRERKLAIDRAYRQRLGPDGVRDRQLRCKYGISLADYRAICAAQGGRCAICEQVPYGTGKSATLHVDHDHVSGLVRGLLCDSCNRAIGLLGERLSVLQRAMHYLARTAHGVAVGESA